MSKKTIRKPAFFGKYNWKAILPWIFQIAVVLALAAMMSIFFCQSVIMQESSMEPSIETGQHLLMNKVTYKFKEPQRGDVIAFKKDGKEHSSIHVKRIIGLPGEKIQIKDGKVYINDSETPLDEPYLPETPEGDYGPYYVPEDSYFMLGDNRNWSKDSRFWQNTYVKKEKVLAKAIFRYYPFNKIGVIEKD